jgi:hypothetical protein
VSGERALVIADVVEDEGEDENEDETEDGFHDVQDFASILRDAEALEYGDIPGATAIMLKAAAADFTEMEIDLLVRTIADRIGVGLRDTRAAWKRALAEVDKRAKAAAAAARAAADQREAEEEQRRREEERAQIWASCGALAENPKLLDEMESVAHKLGLVGEGPGARGVYLTCISRLLATNSVRLLRLGSTASGKNYPVEMVLRLIPKEAVVQISGASPKVLPYYGGDSNDDALKHKVLYVPEAVILDSKEKGVDNEFTAMFRTLISEGHLVYLTVVIDKNGNRETATITKNGPIAAILTTARDVDREMKTRALVQETDESGEQTAKIVKRVLSKPEPEPDLTPWLDLQRFLELDAPYRVDIPFREAIAKAYDQWRKDFLVGAAMRMRRDVSSFLVAAEASAVLHKAQREIIDGVIIATLDDYQHAYEAFGDGLATVHGKASEKVIAVVEAIEELGGSVDLSVKVSVRELAKKLRVSSTSTAWARLMAAEADGAIEQDATLSGRKARFFRVLNTAEELRAKPGYGVFPPPETVRNIFAADYPPETTEQAEQKTESVAKVRI